jgi:hypothetical protein
MVVEPMSERPEAMQKAVRFGAVWVLAVALAQHAAAAPSLAERGDGEAVAPAAGDVTRCEHFAFLRPSISEGLGGPAREALKSWDGEKGGTFGPNGDYYQVDPNNSVIFRIRDGVARKLAGICWVRLKRWHAEHAAV